MRENSSLVNSYKRMCRCENAHILLRPLIEICDYKRVLVEHHLGILEYDHSRISVKVSYGSIRVLGEKLQIRLLSKEKLIITGCIQSITLQQECAI